MKRPSRQCRFFFTLAFLIITRTSATYDHILQVLVYKDIDTILPECAIPSLESLANDVRKFLQEKVTHVVHDDDFVIGNVEGSPKNNLPVKGDGPSVELAFQLKCTFCRFLGYSLRSDNPDSNYNVAFMLRWALQYYLEENIKHTTDASIKECLDENFRILVRVNQKQQKQINSDKRRAFATEEYRAELLQH